MIDIQMSKLQRQYNFIISCILVLDEQARPCLTALYKTTKWYLKNLHLTILRGLF